MSTREEVGLAELRLDRDELARKVEHLQMRVAVLQAELRAETERAAYWREHAHALTAQLRSPSTPRP